MRLRPYIPDLDYDAISGWMPDERTHALWSAGRTPYPLSREGLDALLREIAVKYGDAAFVATDDSGKPVGFFCYGVNTQTNEGMLKFVMVDNTMRGRGCGKEMLRLALKYAFELSGADAVRLVVFSVNDRARRCYESIGFAEESVDVVPFRYKDEEWCRCRMIVRK